MTKDEPRTRSNFILMINSLRNGSSNALRPNEDSVKRHPHPTSHAYLFGPGISLADPGPDSSTYRADLVRFNLTKIKLTMTESDMELRTHWEGRGGRGEASSFTLREGTMASATLEGGDSLRGIISVRHRNQSEWANVAGRGASTDDEASTVTVCPRDCDDRARGRSTRLAVERDPDCPRLVC